MFNNSLKKEALAIHEKTLKKYNETYERMAASAEELYKQRVEAADKIKKIETVVNSIANTPKEYDTKMGKVRQEMETFRKTQEYAQEAYEAAVKAGKNIAGGAAAGLGVAAMAPTALMGIATTFGTAATGTAIASLSGAAAQKAAVAWLGRTFAGFAVSAGTAGMAAGNAFLALAGPVGWGITAASTGVSLISMTNKNREIADKAVSEAKDISKAEESLRESNMEIQTLKIKTATVADRLDMDKIVSFMNRNYLEMTENEQYFMGETVNLAETLSMLLNATVGERCLVRR